MGSKSLRYPNVHDCRQKSFKKKYDHNLKQLGKWLKAWKRGEILRGSSGAKEYRIGFGDVDHIVGLSLVDGDDVFCEYHPEQIVHFDDCKLTVCATLTGDIIRELAAIGAAPRDLIFWVKELRKCPGVRFLPSIMMKSIRDQLAADIIVQSTRFPNIVPRQEEHKAAVDQVRKMFFSLKSAQTDDVSFSIVTSDLRLADYIWFAFAIAHAEAQMPKPGDYGPSVMYAARDSDIYKLQCLSALNIGLIVQHLHLISHHGPGVFISSGYYDAGIKAATRMIATTPRTGPSMLESELAALKIR